MQPAQYSLRPAPLLIRPLDLRWQLAGRQAAQDEGVAVGIAYRVVKVKGDEPAGAGCRCNRGALYRRSSSRGGRCSGRSCLWRHDGPAVVARGPDAAPLGPSEGQRLLMVPSERRKGGPLSCRSPANHGQRSEGYALGSEQHTVDPCGVAAAVDAVLQGCGGAVADCGLCVRGGDGRRALQRTAKLLFDWAFLAGNKVRYYGIVCACISNTVGTN